MKRVQFAAFLVVAFMAVACLLSVPVFPSDGPWDSDGGSNNGGDLDTNSYGDGSNSHRALTTANARPDWFTAVMYRTSLPYIIRYFRAIEPDMAQSSGTAAGTNPWVYHPKGSSYGAEK
ncbi:MAG TPA: hypothetical protein VN285_09755 [Candidatus Deferrimicrobium sp.]|nr:hypothetical protein [Candidatus Deferrimicrobium sp.]